jgi:hypothetical protein
MDALELLGVAPHGTERFSNGKSSLGITCPCEVELRPLLRRHAGKDVDGTQALGCHRGSLPIVHLKPYGENLLYGISERGRGNRKL